MKALVLKVIDAAYVLSCFLDFSSFTRCNLGINMIINVIYALNTVFQPWSLNLREKKSICLFHFWKDCVDSHEGKEG